MTCKYYCFPKIKEFVRFGFTGMISFFVDYCVLVLLTDGFDLHYLISSGISFALSVIMNYIICFKWVFREASKQSLKSVIIFSGTSLLGLLLNQFIMWLFVEQIFINYKLAKIISTLLVMIWNYFMKRKALMI